MLFFGLFFIALGAVLGFVAGASLKYTPGQTHAPRGADRGFVKSSR